MVLTCLCPVIAWSHFVGIVFPKYIQNAFLLPLNFRGSLALKFFSHMLFLGNLIDLASQLTFYVAV